MNGYAEKILYVDLTREQTTEEPFPEEWKRAYIGGRGLGVRIIGDLVNPDVDPLGAENVLVFATGPVAGSGLPLGSRYDVVTKSPLTGTLTSANSGGKFGTSMKRAGFDAVVIRGRAQSPVYLLLDDGRAEIRDAPELWGLTTSETAAAIRNDLSDPGASVACIGPAGERLVRIAGVINETSRAAGRGGVGAVMGAKNLKAVAARGSGRVTVADRDRFLALKGEIAGKIRENAIAGGGRYDNLVSILGGPDVPGIGFAFGLERVVLLLKERPERKGGCFVVAQGDGDVRSAAAGLLTELRSAGVTAQAVLEKSFKAQMRRAGKSGYPLCAIIGQDEMERSQVTLKDMEKSTQFQVPRSDARDKIAELVGAREGECQWRP